jgi:general secretion pathway protein I
MKSKRNNGFTLIEVLIAFTILALVLGVVLPTLSSGLSHERTARLATARVLEARSILDRLGIEEPLEDGSSEGQLATGERWTLTVTLIDDAPVDTTSIRNSRPSQLKAYLAELRIEGEDGRALGLKTLKLGQ